MVLIWTFQHVVPVFQSCTFRIHVQDNTTWKGCIITFRSISVECILQRVFGSLYMLSTNKVSSTYLPTYLPTYLQILPILSKLLPVCDFTGMNAFWSQFLRHLLFSQNNCVQIQRWTPHQCNHCSCRHHNPKLSPPVIFWQVRCVVFHKWTPGKKQRMMLHDYIQSLQYDHNRANCYFPRSSKRWVARRIL